MKLVKWFLQKVPKSHDSQNESKPNQSLTSAQPEYQHRAAYQLNKWYDDPYDPKRPDGQERISERQEILASVFERTQLKDLHQSGHEED